MSLSVPVDDVSVSTRPPKFPRKTTPSPFYPENPASNVIQKLFMDEKSADVVFEVQHRDGGSTPEKKTKTSPFMFHELILQHCAPHLVDTLCGSGKDNPPPMVPVRDVSLDSEEAKSAPTSEYLGPATFYAHRLILQQCAPQLAELCGPMENHSSPVHISISDITPNVFLLVLHYIYGGEVSGEDLEANAKQIIEAADKFGVINLKLEAEACLVNLTTINVDNAMDHLLYADSKNCALLKEAVMDFIVANASDVTSKVSFKNVPGEIVTDVLAAVARGNKKGGDEASGKNSLCTMRINSLRRRVHDKGLEIDGSRKMLIDALDESS